MMHNNKMKGMDIPAEKITKKDALEVIGAMATLMTLCPAMIVGVQMLTRFM